MAPRRDPRSKGNPPLGGAATPNEAIALPLASPIIEKSISFTVGFGASADGREAIVFRADLPALTPGGHAYLEQLGRWFVGRLTPAITRGRVAIVDENKAAEILDVLTLDGAEMLAAGDWADRFVSFLLERSAEILDRAEAASEAAPLGGDAPADDPDALRLRQSIGAPDVARPIDELERRRAAADYRFEPYDVLQCNRRGEWLDFSTLRTDDDARRAIALVRSGMWEGEPLEFRIRRRDIVVAPAPAAAIGDAGDETPAEHIANAIAILRGIDPAAVGPYDFVALEARLTQALEQLRRTPAREDIAIATRQVAAARQILRTSEIELSSDSAATVDGLLTLALVQLRRPE